MNTACRILVVDDQDASRFVKARILTRAGYTIAEARTGAEGLALARQDRPDLVVLDVNLPDMSGLEVCRRLKEEFTSPTIQILQVSQTAVTEADRARGLDHGADMYLIEPLGPEVLLATVRALLRTRQVEVQLELAVAREKLAREEAERANQMKDAFVAMVSHELRTPLNAMTGSIWLLKRGAKDPASFDRALDMLDRNARVQVQLINDLLDVSRISAGKLEVDLQPIDLRPVIEAAVESSFDAPAHKRKHIDVEVRVAPARVYGDAMRLEQVVSNLLNNAFQFTPEGGSIVVSCGVESEKAFIRVSDTGAGIDPEFLPHVFERFRQARAMASGRDRGLGLGLAIVHYLVERHNGQVTLDSAGVGKGTTCTITLPLLDVKPDAPGVAFDLPESSLAGLRILLVEDDPDAREVLASILAGYGAGIIAVETGAAALESLRGSAFDVVVSDVGLPDLDGVELLRRVRELGRLQPAIAVTAFASEDDRRRLLGGGFHAHVAKPVDPERLVRTVARATGRKPGQTIR
ncbi:MAG TPA: response regulator [Vicinamibacterales bacterium]|nr:response regulator [Vicinamibacterales bacterium]